MEFSSFFKDFRNRVTSAAEGDMFPLIREAWDFQLEHNNVLREFVERCKRPFRVSDVSDITFLPIEFFKSHKVVTGLWKPQTYFQSSGTSGEQRSKHWIDDQPSYEDRAMKCFDSLDPDQRVCHFFFLPFYEANPHSSLIAMASAMMDKTKENGSRFFKDIHQLDKNIKLRIADGLSTYVWSVSYGLMDFYEGHSGSYPNVTFIETGGMKGTRQEMPKGVLHAQARAALKHSRICSEYGMCELTSQAYMGEDWFVAPKGMQVLIAEQQDVFNLIDDGRRGAINIIDLHNIHSCCFIKTQDLGMKSNLGFRVLGRMDDSALRGCNLMYGDAI